MSRFRTVWHGTDFRDSYLALMATRFPAAAVDRKRRAWEWLFASPCSTAEQPTRVFAVERDGRAVGAFIQVPCRYVIDGHESPAMHPIATVVHPDHAGAGPVMLNAQLHIPGHLAIGVPNRYRLSKIYTRYEGLLSPPRTLRRRVYRPGSILARQKKAPAGLGPVLNAAAWAPVAATGLRRARLRRDERMEPVSAFGREFDAAWEEAATSVAFAQSRRASFLNWRYRDMPLNRYECLALRRGGKLAGYVVTAVQEAAGGRAGRVTDIFAYEGARRDYALLLAAADARFRRTGCDFAEISHGGVPEIGAAARRTGFLLRKTILPLVMRHDVGELNAKLPELARRIHFCRGDHDEDY